MLCNIMLNLCEVPFLQLNLIVNLIGLLWQICSHENCTPVCVDLTTCNSTLEFVESVNLGICTTASKTLKCNTAGVIE